MRAKAEDRREWVRTMSRLRNARAARVYRGRRVAAVFDRGCAGGDGEDMEPVGRDKGVVVASLTGMKGADGTVGDIVRVLVGMFSSGRGTISESRVGWVELTDSTWCGLAWPSAYVRCCRFLGLARWAQQGKKGGCQT